MLFKIIFCHKETDRWRERGKEGRKERERVGEREREMLFLNLLVQK